MKKKLSTNQIDHSPKSVPIAFSKKRDTILTVCRNCFIDTSVGK